MNNKLYTNAQALHAKADNFLNQLMNSPSCDFEILEEAIRYDAKMFMTECYAKRMTLKMAELVKAARNRE